MKMIDEMLRQGCSFVRGRIWQYCEEVASAWQGCGNVSIGKAYI
jgi:hypothetical protein